MEAGEARRPPKAEQGATAGGPCRERGQTKQGPPKNELLDVSGWPVVLSCMNAITDEVASVVQLS